MILKKTTSNMPDFLQWINQYFGLWTLICTPGHEHMDPGMMADLIEKLSAAGLDELIFVLITVHRKEPFVAHFYRTMLLDMITKHWENERENIVQKMIDHLQ